MNIMPLHLRPEGWKDSTMEIKFDCRYYLGEKPCKYKRLCPGCNKYKPMGIRVLIIKLGAMGDALRTTALLHGIKRIFHHCVINWVTDQSSFPILKNNPLIDRLFVISNPVDLLIINSMQFDVMYSLDKCTSAIALAMQVNALDRKGYAMTQWGTLDIFNDASQFSLMLGLDDDLKFNFNSKTYQETIFDIAEIRYEHEEYVFQVSESGCEMGFSLLRRLKAPGAGPKIGLNTGCGSVFETKKWPDDHFQTLAYLLRKHLDAQVYLLGGESEQTGNRSIEKKMESEVLNTGSHDIDGFAGIVSQMDLIVTSDSMALHLALALQKRVIGLFGPTCHQEIHYYGRGRSLIGKKDCSPCYRSKCRHDVSCMSLINPIDVLDAIQDVLKGETHR